MFASEALFKFMVEAAGQIKTSMKLTLLTHDCSLYQFKELSLIWTPIQCREKNLALMWKTTNDAKQCPLEITPGNCGQIN